MSYWNTFIFILEPYSCIFLSNAISFQKCSHVLCTLILVPTRMCIHSCYIRNTIIFILEAHSCIMLSNTISFHKCNIWLLTWKKVHKNAYLEDFKATELETMTLHPTIDSCNQSSLVVVTLELDFRDWGDFLKEFKHQMTVGIGTLEVHPPPSTNYRSSQ